MHNCRFFELRWKKPMKMMNSIIMTGFGRISAACGCHTGSQVWTVNVGDSRCFLLRDGKLQQISEDQTDEAYMKENGIHGRKPYLTQYMGMDPEEVRVLPYADCLQLKKGDRFLICSDGVSDMVSIEFLETMLLQTQSPAKCVDTILAAALEAGGKDNITVIVLEINR